MAMVFSIVAFFLFFFLASLAGLEVLYLLRQVLDVFLEVRDGSFEFLGAIVVLLDLGADCDDFGLQSGRSLSDSLEGALVSVFRMCFQYFLMKSAAKIGGFCDCGKGAMSNFVTSSSLGRSSGLSNSSSRDFFCLGEDPVWVAQGRFSLPIKREARKRAGKLETPAMGAV